MVVIFYNLFLEKGKCLRLPTIPSGGFLVEESNTPPRGAAARSLRLPRQLYMKRMEVAEDCRPVASNALECALSLVSASSSRITASQTRGRVRATGAQSKMCAPPLELPKVFPRRPRFLVLKR